jgi:hypothetical protein
MQKMLLLLLALVVSALSLTAPASGVWGGELDGNRHPMVGAIYADLYPPFDGPQGDEIVCSGSYAGPSKDGNHDAFLTAAHCIALLVDWGVTDFSVSFDPDPQDPDDESPGLPDRLIPASEFHWDPRFSEQIVHGAGPIETHLKNNNWYDSGVLLLPRGSVGDIDPVQLPTARYLDELKAEGELMAKEFELVGYGVQPTWQQPGGPQIPFIPDGKRRRSFSTASGLTAAWLRLLQNPHATGLGGVCLFDSGSPQFLPGTRRIVSTTSDANGSCHAISRNYRLDTPAARRFLDRYLTLP